MSKPPTFNEAESQAPYPSLSDAGFEELLESRPQGLFRRGLTTYRHLGGLVAGGLIDYVRTCPPEKRRFFYRLLRIFSWFLRPFIDRQLRALPFPVQLRRRLEILGPTYIKLGQILSLREDILPTSVTEELKNLLDRLPAVPYPRYLELIVEDLQRPINEMYSWVDPVPTGSASIAQSHRATTVEGDAVIIKVVKPGIKRTLERDARLLKTFGAILQIFIGRFQPRRVIAEFTEYTLREVDLRREADNAETFAANFKDQPAVAFPKIYREYCGPSVLTMEFFDGVKPDSDAALELAPEDRDKIIHVGAGAIIRMLYRDGFFHADLHPGNLLILPGPRAGFIDLGMVGRMDEEVRRTMMYYYYCLVIGDVENGARYLASVADVGPGGDAEGFRKAVEDVSRRWRRSSNFKDFSLAQLILESVAMAGQYRIYFPVEMVLMVKALVTFEGVGNLLHPGFDVASVSRTHISKIFFNQFNPLRIAKESLRGAPELLDAVVKAPLLVTEGIRLLEQATRKRSENPFDGVRGTIFGGFCVVASAILMAAGAASSGPWWQLWPAWGPLLVIGLIAALNKKS